MTTRTDFLAALKAKAEPLHPITITGMPTFFVRLETMADVRTSLLRGPGAGAGKTMKEALKADGFLLERSMARVIRDESGALVFDPDDDASMQELRDGLDGVSIAFDEELRQKIAALSKPTSAEVDPSGNSLSASS